MKRVILTLLLLFGGLSGEILASPSIVGSLDIPWGSGVHVSGSFAYVGGLAVKKLDVSNPQNPTIINSMPTSNFSIEDIYISGNYAYVAADIAGLLIMDISDLNKPILIGSVDTPIRARSVFVSGKYAYVATWGEEDLYIIDISNPQRPVIMLSVDLSPSTWGNGVCVSDHLVYLAGGIGGLHVIDVTNPLFPVYAGSVLKKGTPNPEPFTTDHLFPEGVFVSGFYAFVADIDGLQILDISDLQNPVLAGSVDIPPSGASDVYVAGSFAYVTSNPFQGKVYIIDVSDFTGPSIPPDPSVIISLNKNQFVPGDQMKVTLTTSSGTKDNDWDVYVGVILPDNTLYVMTFEPSFTLTSDIVPACPSKTIKDESVTILDIILPEGLPFGNWQWVSVLGKDNFSRTSDLSWAPFTLSNVNEEFDLTGWWTVHETITGNCNGIDYPYTSTYMGEFLQTGNNLTFKSTFNNTNLTGYVSGNVTTLNGMRHDAGTISIDFTGTVSGENDRLAGVSTWIWTDGSNSCSGSADIMMTKNVQSTAINVSGTWQGHWQSYTHGISGYFDAIIIQKDSTLSGTINVPEIGLNNSKLKGTVFNNNITFGDIDDKITFTGTVIEESTASGTYSFPSISDGGVWQGNRN